MKGQIAVMLERLETSFGEPTLVETRQMIAKLALAAPRARPMAHRFMTTLTSTEARQCRRLDTARQFLGIARDAGPFLDVLVDASKRISEARHLTARIRRDTPRGYLNADDETHEPHDPQARHDIMMRLIAHADAHRYARNPLNGEMLPGGNVRAIQALRRYLGDPGVALERRREALLTGLAARKATLASVAAAALCHIPINEQRFNDAVTSTARHSPHNRVAPALRTWTRRRLRAA